MRQLVALLLLSAPAWAQKDFLTADEADQVREAQDPSMRLTLYTHFAKQRIDLLEQAFAKEKTGRGGLIHDTLEQYTQIIEALDIVADEALHKGKEVTVLGDIAKAQREMLAKLEGFLASEPRDLARFKFVLDQAIETTRDSVEMSEQDLKERTQNVQAREKQIKEEQKAMSAPSAKPEAPAADAAKAAEEGKPAAKPAGTRKPPTLRRPGEVTTPKPGSTKP